MKELRFWLIFFTCVAAVCWFCNRITRDELPGRESWNGRTYTNEEAGIRLTVPEEYKIFTDEEMIEMYHCPEDIYKNVKSESNYFDMQIKSGDALLYTVYMITGFSGTAEQYTNLIEVNYNQVLRGKGRKAVSTEKFENVLCGQAYRCLGMTYEDEEPYYLLWCFRYIAKKGWVFIHIEAGSKDEADKMLEVFDLKTVNANGLKKIFWWFERVF